MNDNIKLAAPKWLKLLRSGSLSPEALSKITAALPEGKAKFVRPLGTGFYQQADLMAGNIGNQPGLVVRKLPRRVDNINQIAANQLEASRQVAAKFKPGAVARYLPADPSKGVFQEYGNKVIDPNWKQKADYMQKAYAPINFEESLLKEKLIPTLYGVKNSLPYSFRGIQDTHVNNFGPGGQLIDYIYKLPRGQVAGGAPVSPEYLKRWNDNFTIDRFSQNLKTPSKIGPEPRSGFFGDPLAHDAWSAKANADAVRKYWLGKRVPIKNEEIFLNKPLVDVSAEANPGIIQQAFKQMPKFNQLPGVNTIQEAIPKLRSLLKIGSDNCFYKLAAKIGPMLSRRGFITGVPKAAPVVAAAAMSNPAAAAKAVASVAAPNLLQRVLTDHTNRAKFRVYGSAELPRRDFVKTLPAAVNNNLRVVPEVGVNQIVNAVDKVGLKKKLQPYLIPGGLVGSTSIPAAAYVFGPTVAKMRMPFLSTFNSITNTLHGNALDAADALSLSAPSVQEQPQEVSSNGSR